MTDSLYEAVGGLPTLQHVHKIFYDKIYAHPWLQKFFEEFEQQVIEDRQTSFMGEKFGGPAYIGKPLKQVHENMYIRLELADIRHEILRESLCEAKVPEELAERWLRIDSAFMQQVIKTSVESFYRDYHTNLEKAVDPHNITQALVSPSYMKKACFTNQVKTTFFITLFKTISCILFARPTVFSRFKYKQRIIHSNPDV